MTDEWHLFKPLFIEKSVPARTILLREGQISRTMFFIEKGCLRTWINSDGKDITTQFFFEGSSVSSFESFRTNEPGLYNIESLEPSILQTISQHDFYQYLEKHPAIRRKMEDHLFRRLLQIQQVFYSFLKNNPQQRYNELLEKHPEILQRVPQHYIASYLGITSVSLSRIRNRK